MKNISAARREQEAALARRQERAEAEAAGKKPQGEGVAAQRKAIIEGRSESVEGFPTTAVGSSPREVTSLGSPSLSTPGRLSEAPPGPTRSPFGTVPDAAPARNRGRAALRAFGE